MYVSSGSVISTIIYQKAKAVHLITETTPPTEDAVEQPETKAVTETFQEEIINESVQSKNEIGEKLGTSKNSLLFRSAQLLLIV